MRIKRRKTRWGIEFEELEVSHDTPGRRRGAGHSIQQDLEPDEIVVVSPCAFCEAVQQATNNENVRCILHAEQYKKGETNESRNS